MSQVNQSINRQGLYEFIKAQKNLVDLRSFPNFLILGPQCTASTWLHRNLGKHPQIFMSHQKEIFFFCEYELTESFRRGKIPDFNAYMRHFKVPDMKNRATVIGEATASYAWQPVEIIRGITELNPDMKGVILIRDPVQKVWSNMRRIILTGSRSPLDMNDEEISDFIHNPHQINSALFTQMISNWSQCLKRGNLYVGLFDDVSRRPVQLLLDLFTFLGVESNVKHISEDAYRKIRVGREWPLTQRWKFELENIFRDELIKLKNDYGLDTSE